jgi:hypothetical protein
MSNESKTSETEKRGNEAIIVAGFRGGTAEDLDLETGLSTAWEEAIADEATRVRLAAVLDTPEAKLIGTESPFAFDRPRAGFGIELSAAPKIVVMWVGTVGVGVATKIMVDLAS